MEKEEIINKILKELLPIFLENIEESNKDKISNLYKEYFVRKYDSLFSGISSDTDIEKLLSILKNRELNEWKNLNEDSKMSIIVEDKNLQELYFLSHKAFSLAQNKLYNEELISGKEAEELRTNLLNKYELVSTYNKDRAKMELSEALLDVDYASGVNENINSLRIGMEYRTKMQLKTK